MIDVFAEPESWRRQKLCEIQQALDSDPVDIETLRTAATSEGGLLNDDIRRKVWPKLLNVNIYSLPPKPGETHTHTHTLTLSHTHIPTRTQAHSHTLTHTHTPKLI